MRKNKGISLITLVVIIVIIIILAGVSILNLSKNNPIGNATIAKVKSDYDAFSTNLELYKANMLTKDMYEDVSSINTPPYDIEKLVPTIKDEKFHGVNYKDIFTVYKGELLLKTDLEIDNDTSIENKDNVKKKRDEVAEILGLKRRGDEESNIAPDMPVITLYYSDGTLLKDNRYTKENITANISTNIITTGYHLEYYDSQSKKWTELIDKDSNVTISNNCYIIARIINDDGEEIGTTSTYTIDVIDKKAPVNVVVTKETEQETSFTISISAEDIEGDGYAQSGIKEYDVYTLKDGEEYKKETIKENTYTLSKLDMSSSYEVYVVARDNALNETESDTILITTSSTKPTISVNKTAYTNLKNEDGTDDPLIVTIGMTEVPEGYTIEYSIDNGANYTEIYGNEDQINITKNCIIKARLSKEGSTYVYADDKEITNIDTLAPKQVTLTYITGTTNTLTLKAVAKDADSTSEDAKSGIVSYEFHIGDKVVTEEVENGEEEKEITIEGLSSGTKYTCYVVVKDVAGNTKQSANITQDTEKAIYTVTYYANNGTNDNKTDTKVQDTDYTVLANTFAKSEYKFTTWNTKQDGTGTTYAAGEKYTGNSALDLYAQWEINVSNLIVDPNGGSIKINDVEITEEKTYKQICSSTLSYKKPTKTSTSVNTKYTVTYNYNGNGQSNTTDSVTRLVVTEYQGSLEKTEPFKGTLTNTTGDGTYTYPSVGGITDKITANYTSSILSDTSSSITLPSPTRTGYTFDGWYNGETKVTSPYTPTGNVTLTAHWTQNESSLVVDPKDGTIKVTSNGTTDTLSAAKTYTQKSGTTLSYTLPTKEKDITDTDYTVTLNHNYTGSINGSLKATKTTTVTFKGSLTKSTTFNGTLSSTTTAGTYTFPNTDKTTDTVTASYEGKTTNTTTEVTLTSPTRTGYIFGGWNTKADGSGTNYNGGEKYKPAGNVTLYAKWTANEYTYTFYINDGNVYSIYTNGILASKTGAYGTKLEKPSNPTRTGYTFKGWATSSSSTTVVTVDSTYSSNKNYYAIWERNTYQVTYNANGGSNPPSAQTKTHGQTLTLSSTMPTRTGYTFGGWNTKADGSGTSYAAGGKYTGNTALTLYAQWALPSIGDYVAYTPKNGCDVKWRIFYEDTNIYLIAEDYVENSYLSSAGFGTNGVYSVYSSISRQDLIDRISNTAYYEKFKDTAGKAKSVVGAPTLEQFVKSYNTVNENKIELHYYTTANETYGGYTSGAEGYGLKFASEAEFDLSVSIGSGNKRDLYVRPNKEDRTYILWLASFSANSSYFTGASYLMDVISGGSIGFHSYDYDKCGLRPLVCLNSGVKLIDSNNDGIWEIQ